MGYSPQECKESDMPEVTLHTCTQHTVNIAVTTVRADIFMVCICWTAVSVRIMLVAMINKTLKFESLSSINVYLSITW